MPADPNSFIWNENNYFCWHKIQSFKVFCFVFQHRKEFDGLSRKLIEVIKCVTLSPSQLWHCLQFSEGKPLKKKDRLSLCRPGWLELAMWNRLALYSQKSSSLPTTSVGVKRVPPPLHSSVFVLKFKFTLIPNYLSTLSCKVAFEGVIHQQAPFS